MRKMSEIPIYGLYSTYLTSSAVQCKIMWFLVLFWYFGQLGTARGGKILKFIENRYEIRIQHAKNVGNTYLRAL